MTATRTIFGIAAAIAALGAWGACREYVASSPADPGDSASTSSGGPATPPPPGSSTSSTSSSSGNYAPTWKPSWDGNIDGGLSVSITSSCAGVGSSSGSLSGTYQAIAGCFDKRVFSEFFQKYCAGAEVGRGEGLVNSTLTVTGTNLVRSGDFKLASEITIPCKGQFQNSCAQMQATLLFFASQGGAEFDYDIKCYDVETRADACACQMELAGAYPDDPFVINAAARTMTDGSRVLEYGPAPPSLTRVLRTDDTDAVPLENSLVLDYVQN